MKLSTVVGIAGLAATAQAHATFQYFWTNSADRNTSTNSCIRAVANNNPLTSTGSNIACNSPATAAASTCTVAAGSSVSVEMHQQPGDRTCTTEAIGGNHDGPVIIYMAKVADAGSANPASVSWFKVAQTGLVSYGPYSGTDYVWGTDVMNNNCGQYTFTIPASIASGQYLVRAEVIALHVASQAGGAQHYASCFQVNVTGGGSASPSGVLFPGAYSATDPGILFTVWQTYTTYTIPGPTVYGGGAGPVSSSAAASTSRTSSSSVRTSSSSVRTTSTSSSVRSSSTSSRASSTSSANGATQTQFGQCGGSGYTGPTVCQSPYVCTKSNDFYSQCL